MTVYMIRHGETGANQKKLLQGRTNAPLNENGILQARSAADFLNRKHITFDRILSSPLIRAMETARILVGEGTPILEEERLLEMDFGPYDGISLADPPAEILQFFQDFVHHPAPAGMEPLDHVVGRLGSLLEELATEEPGSVLLSTHAIALKGALEYLTPDSGGRYWNTYLSNCSIFRTEYAGGHFSPPEEIFSTGYRPGV